MTSGQVADVGSDRIFFSKEFVEWRDIGRVQRLLVVDSLEKFDCAPAGRSLATGLIE